MATYAETQHVRLMLGEPTGDDSLFSDETINGWIDAAANLDAAILQGWRAKAAHFANLVNVTDGAASREFSDLLDNAAAMVKQYTSLARGPAAGRTRVGKIVRQ